MCMGSNRSGVFRAYNVCNGVQMDPKSVGNLALANSDFSQGGAWFAGANGLLSSIHQRLRQIARSLTELLKKDQITNFKWAIEAQKTFERLQHEVTSAPVLVTTDFSSHFVVECDASGNGIAFFSKAVSNLCLAKSA